MTSRNIIITIIVALVVGTGAFYGGTVYEKSSLAKQNLLREANGQGNGGQRRGPGQGGGLGGAGFARGGNGDFVAGDVISKDDPAPEQAQNGAGKSITVKTRDGGTKIIFFSDSTTIGKSVQGSISDLASGQQVMVSGKSNPDGTFTSHQIMINNFKP